MLSPVVCRCSFRARRTLRFLLLLAALPGATSAVRAQLVQGRFVAHVITLDGSGQPPLVITEREATVSLPVENGTETLIALADASLTISAPAETPPGIQTGTRVSFCQSADPPDDGRIHGPSHRVRSAIAPFSRIGTGLGPATGCL